MEYRIPKWTRVSYDAVYDGKSWDGTESWTILVAKLGTAGSLYTVTLGYENRTADGYWYIGAHNCTEFVGYDALERASEYFGLN